MTNESKIDDINLTISDFTAINMIEGFRLTEEGDLSALLSDDFGGNKVLILKPRMQRRGYNFMEWHCEIEKNLGIPKMAS